MRFAQKTYLPPPEAPALSDAESPGAPRHVAIIMDGNGRWATQRGLPRTFGHERGADAVRRCVTAARQRGIQALTLFAFSAQNWARPNAEVGHLFSLFRRFLRGERKKMQENGVRLRVVGDRTRLSDPVRSEILAAESATAPNDALTLYLAVSYGGQEEIVQGMRAIARQVAQGILSPDDVSADIVQDALWSAEMPPVDLLIRTSGEQRLSNFLPWQTAYAELFFTPCLWPDFDEAELDGALAAYASRHRRFGTVGP